MRNGYNVGVIGLGEQTWNNLLPSLAILPYVDIGAVCDIDEGKSNIAARNYGATAYQGFADMIDCEKLDAVIVASHPDIHKQVLQITIPRGIPTFIEKPPTLETRDLHHLIELNKEFETTTAVGLNFSFTEPMQFLKGLMKSDEFGDIEHLQVSHYGNKPDSPIWGLESLSKSFLLSQAIHPLGLILDMGEMSNKSPEVSVHKNDVGVLYDVSMMLKSKKGNLFNANLLTCSTAPFFDWELQMISSTGIRVKVNSLWEIKVYSRKQGSPLISNRKWWRDTWKPSPLSGGFKRNGYQY